MPLVYPQLYSFPQQQVLADSGGTAVLAGLGLSFLQIGKNLASNSEAEVAGQRCTGHQGQKLVALGLLGITRGLSLLGPCAH